MRSAIQAWLRGIFLATLLWCVLALSPAWAEGMAEFPQSKGNLGNEVLYYITVDRFFDGDRDNNIPDFAFPVAGVGGDRQAYNQANRSLLRYSYDPSHRYVGMYWGGDLAGILQKLDYLQDLGITKLVLSPIQDSANGITYSPGGKQYLHATVDPDDEAYDPFYAGVSAPFSGNWTKDWFEVDEHFRSPSDELQNGGDRLQTFRRLLDAAGQRGIGILLELSLNHTSPYRDSATYAPFDPETGEQWLIDNGAVYRHGERVATYLDPQTATLNPEGWFHPPMGINYLHTTPEMLERGAVGGLPDLAQEQPEVREYFLDAIRYWLTVNPGGHQVAGFYLEDIPNISRDFWQDLERTAVAVNPDAILIGEYSGGGYKNQGAIAWYANTENYALVDYDFSLSSRHFFGRQRGWDGRTYVLQEIALGRDGKYYNDPALFHALHRLMNPSQVLEIPRSSLDRVADADALGWVKFVEHHDQPRIFSSIPSITETAYASLLKYVFTSPGVPLVMYGMETGLAVPYHLDHQGLYGVGGNPFNQPMMIWQGEPGWNEVLHATTRDMAHLRREYPVLRYGDTRFLYPNGSRSDKDLFMIREMPEDGTERLLYAYSTFGGDFTLSFQAEGVTQMVDVESNQEFRNVNGLLAIHLEPEESRVFVLR